MPVRSIFKNTHTRSYLPSDDFIEGWETLLRDAGYEKGRKGYFKKNNLEVRVMDTREGTPNEGRNKIDQLVKVEYWVHISGGPIPINKDIPLEQFEILAEELIEKIKS